MEVAAVGPPWLLTRSGGRPSPWKSGWVEEGVAEAVVAGSRFLATDGGQWAFEGDGRSGRDQVFGQVEFRWWGSLLRLRHLVALEARGRPGKNRRRRRRPGSQHRDGFTVGGDAVAPGPLGHLGLGRITGIRSSAKQRVRHRCVVARPAITGVQPDHPPQTVLAADRHQAIGLRDGVGRHTENPLR